MIGKEEKPKKSEAWKSWFMILQSASLNSVTFLGLIDYKWAGKWPFEFLDLVLITPLLSEGGNEEIVERVRKWIFKSSCPSWIYLVNPLFVFLNPSHQILCSSSNTFRWNSLTLEQSLKTFATDFAEHKYAAEMCWHSIGHKMTGWDWAMRIFVFPTAVGSARRWMTRVRFWGHSVNRPISAPRSHMLSFPKLAQGWKQ